MKISVIKLAWVVGLAALAVLAAWSVWQAQASVSAELDGWRITAGPIEASQGLAGKRSREISGSYRLQTSQQPPGKRLAGACLVANLTNQGIGLASCQTHKQCNDAYLSQPSPLLAGAHLYCLSEKTAGGPAQCWTRPGPDTEFCTKGPHDPGSFSVPAAPRTLASDPLGTGQPVEWRVLGCLNPAEFQGMPPCAVPDSPLKIYVSGPVRKVSH